MEWKQEDRIRIAVRLIPHARAEWNSEGAGVDTMQRMGSKYPITLFLNIWPVVPCRAQYL